MIIVFKNGKEKEVSRAIAVMLDERIRSNEGAKPWQTFTDEDGIIIIINLNEVCYITR